MIFKKKSEMISVHWGNCTKLNLERGKWLITTYYFLGIPLYKNYQQETFYG
jgi:hypothetical protein